MGRPAKSIGLRSGHVTKAEKERRGIIERRLRGGTGDLSAPEFLSDEERNVFEYIVDLLRESAVLSGLDVYVLTNCAIAIVRIRKYDEMIASDPGLLDDKDIIGNRSKIVNEFLRYCNELCLSPQARAKIGTAAVAKSQEAVDPIAQILGGDFESSFIESSSRFDVESGFADSGSMNGNRKSISRKNGDRAAGISDADNQRTGISCSDKQRTGFSDKQGTDALCSDKQAIGVSGVDEWETDGAEFDGRETDSG